MIFSGIACVWSVADELGHDGAGATAGPGAGGAKMGTGGFGAFSTSAVPFFHFWNSRNSAMSAGDMFSASDEGSTR